MARKLYFRNAAGARYGLNGETGVYITDLSGLGLALTPGFADLKTGFFVCIDSETEPQNAVAGTLIFTGASAYAEWRRLADWLAAAGMLELIYCPYGSTEYARQLVVNYISKGERDELGWLRTPISLLPSTPWYLPTVTPTEIGSGGAENPAVYDAVYTDALIYGSGSAASITATIYPSGHIPAAVLLRYTGAIVSPSIRLSGASSGAALGLCSIDYTTGVGDTLEFSTVRTDCHVRRISADGVITDLLDKVDLSSVPFFQIPIDEPCVLSVESNAQFGGAALLTVYYYSRSV